MNGFTGILVGVLVGCAVRLVVLARQNRRLIEQQQRQAGIDLQLDGLTQRTLDRLIVQPGCPTHDAQALANYLAQQTGHTIIARQVDGDGMVIAIPDPEATHES